MALKSMSRYWDLWFTETFICGPETLRDVVTGKSSDLWYPCDSIHGISAKSGNAGSFVQVASSKRLLIKKQNFK